MTTCCAPSIEGLGGRASEASEEPRKRLGGPGGAQRPPGQRSDAPARTEGMSLIPGGPFLMGTDTKDGFPADGEGPIRKVHLKTFLIDKTAVTNAQFAEFVKATGYKTEAERIGW